MREDGEGREKRFSDNLMNNQDMFKTNKQKKK